jgi:hypothetical protein
MRIVGVRQNTAGRVNGGRADPWKSRWDGPLNQQTAEMKGQELSDPLFHCAYN